MAKKKVIALVSEGSRNWARELNDLRERWVYRKRFEAEQFKEVYNEPPLEELGVNSYLEADQRLKQVKHIHGLILHRIVGLKKQRNNISDSDYQARKLSLEAERIYYASLRHYFELRLTEFPKPTEYIESEAVKRLKEHSKDALTESKNKAKRQNIRLSNEISFLKVIISELQTYILELSDIHNIKHLPDFVIYPPYYLEAEDKKET